MGETVVLDPVHFLIVFMVCAFIATCFMVIATCVIGVMAVSISKRTEAKESAAALKVQRELDEAVFAEMSKPVTKIDAPMERKENST